MKTSTWAVKLQLKLGMERKPHGKYQATKTNSGSTKSELPSKTAYEIDSNVYYLTTSSAVNKALKGITDGVVGFDTEYMPRLLGPTEKHLEYVFDTMSGNAKTAIQTLHVLATRNGKYKIKWDRVGLCVVQIAKDNDVWVINMKKMRDYPKELKRVLESTQIKKAGVGVHPDLSVIWYDLGSDMKSVVDCGLMAKLLLVDETENNAYKDTAFTNLSMATSARAILGKTIDKDLQRSNWTGDKDGELSAEQIKYAAIDAQAALRLYETIQPQLEEKALGILHGIPSGWYTMDGAYGEAVRTKRSIRGQHILWSSKDCPWFGGGKFLGYENF
ncbi:ribonuclease H-like domain-containing protein [Mycena epipterygia]|nr:ribonuclease H-like domain-containing protein [Mycena epipterygia]